MTNLPATLRKFKNFIRLHKVVFAVIFVLFFTLVLLSFINRTLFQESTAQSTDASSSVVAQLNQILEKDFATPNELTSIVNTNLETLQNDMQSSTVGYPQSLALLTEPLSTSNRNKINQIYLSSDTTSSSTEGLKVIKETQDIVTSLPNRDSIENNTDEFIKQYEAAYNSFRTDQSSLNLDTIMKITEIIRDSATIYKSSGDIDIFYSRYDNVFSEMDKELLISYVHYLEDSISFFEVYSNQLQSL